MRRVREARFLTALFYLCFGLYAALLAMRFIPRFLAGSQQRTGIYLILSFYIAVNAFAVRLLWIPLGFRRRLQREECNQDIAVLPIPGADFAGAFFRIGAFAAVFGLLCGLGGMSVVLFPTWPSVSELVKSPIGTITCFNAATLWCAYWWLLVGGKISKVVGWVAAGVLLWFVSSLAMAFFLRIEIFPRFLSFIVAEVHSKTPVYVCYAVVFAVGCFGHLYCRRHYGRTIAA